MLFYNKYDILKQKTKGGDGIKRISRIICLLICFMMLIQLLPVMISAAEENDIYYCREALKDLPNSDALLYAYDELVKGIGAREDVFKVTDGINHITVEELAVVYDAYRRDHTEHFWMGNQYSYTYNPENGNVVEFKPQYVISAEALPEAKAKFNSAISNILAKMDSSLSEYEKEKYLHDTLASMVTYEEGENAHNAYGAIVEGKAVCEGYAEALQCLLHASNIQSLIVLGSSVNPSTNQEEGHAWNMVRIDNRYYHTDLTWNDQDNILFYAYFNQDDNSIKLDHTIQPTVFELPVCNSAAANYFVLNELIVSGYSKESISKLLKDNSLYARIYILGDVDDFTNWFYQNIQEIASGAGVNPPYTYGTIGIGRELHLIIETCAHTELTKVEAKSPTCTENGNKEYYLCKCGKYFDSETGKNEITARDSVIILGGHSFTKAVEDTDHLKYAPTSCQEHYQYYYECKECGIISAEHYFESENVGAHKLTKTEGVESTCARGGKLPYYSCECGKIFEDSEGTKEISDINLFGNLDRLTEHKEVGRNGKCTECGAVIEPINDVTKTAGICILIGTSLIVIVIASRKRRK